MDSSSGSSSNERKVPRLSLNQRLNRSVSYPGEPQSPMTNITTRLNVLPLATATGRRSSASEDDGTPICIRSNLGEAPQSADSDDEDVSFNLPGTGPSLPSTPDLENSFDQGFSRAATFQRKRTSSVLCDDGDDGTFCDEDFPIEDNATSAGGEGLGQLLGGAPIQNTPTGRLKKNRSSAQNSKRVCASTPSGESCFKRPRNDIELSSQSSAEHPSGAGAERTRPRLQRSNHLPVFARSFSETDASGASERGNWRTADNSRDLLFEVTTHKEKAVECISVQTVADLLNGVYGDEVQHLLIVDCRYPYEFDAGHIVNAENHYLPDTLYERLFFPNSDLLLNRDPEKRTIVVFHCEFSSERAPNMLLNVRGEDRKRNTYPNLYYPEMFVMKGGYKAFFESYGTVHCDPPCYLPMHDERFSCQLRHYRSECSQDRRGQQRQASLARSASARQLKLF